MVLDRLSSQAGHWHELARLLPGLAAAGYDGGAIEERCGIERATQGRWVISLSVRAPCCVIRLSPVPGLPRDCMAWWMRHLHGLVK